MAGQKTHGLPNRFGSTQPAEDGRTLSGTKCSIKAKCQQWGLTLMIKISIDTSFAL
jgi:hypothetical protein